MSKKTNKSTTKNVATKAEGPTTEAITPVEKVASEHNLTVEELEAAAEKIELRGRPVDPNSERQKRLAAMEERKNSGLPEKPGRPVDPNSARQKRLAERAAKIAAKIEANKAAMKDGAIEVNVKAEKKTEPEVETIEK